jgi:hypothetical protein
MLWPVFFLSNEGHWPDFWLSEDGRAELPLISSNFGSLELYDHNTCIQRTQSVQVQVLLFSLK